MTRAQRFGTLAGSLSIFYTLAFFSIVPLPLVSNDVAAQLLPVLPFWILVSFGSYALWSLGWGLFTFRDCPDAYVELMKEVDQAKEELRAQGVSVD